MPCFIYRALTPEWRALYKSTASVRTGKARPASQQRGSRNHSCGFPSPILLCCYLVRFWTLFRFREIVLQPKLRSPESVAFHNSRFKDIDGLKVRRRDAHADFLS